MFTLRDSEKMLIWMAPTARTGHPASDPDGYPGSIRQGVADVGGKVHSLLASGYGSRTASLRKASGTSACVGRATTVPFPYDQDQQITALTPRTRPRETYGFVCSVTPDIRRKTNRVNGHSSRLTTADNGEGVRK